MEEVNKAITTLEEELEIILRDNRSLRRGIEVGKRAEFCYKSNKKRMQEIIKKLMEV